MVSQSAHAQYGLSGFLGGVLDVRFPAHLRIEDPPQELGCLRGLDGLPVHGDRAFSWVFPSPGEMYQLGLLWHETRARAFRLRCDPRDVFILDLVEVLFGGFFDPPAEVVVNVCRSPALRVNRLVHKVRAVEDEEDREQR